MHCRKYVLGYGRWSDLVQILPDLHSCFFNIDAAYWEFFSRDAVIVQLVEAHARALPNIVVESTELRLKQF